MRRFVFSAPMITLASPLKNGINDDVFNKNVRIAATHAFFPSRNSRTSCRRRCGRCTASARRRWRFPDNIICFCRRSATDLNRPQRGRALHHRFVLILALETAVTVAVDDRAIRLNPDEGLLVLPFQFHDYIQPEREELRWLFITFDMIDAVPLQALRFRPVRPHPGRPPDLRRAGRGLPDARRGRPDEPAAFRAPAEDTPGGADPPAPPQAGRSRPASSCR